MVLEVVSAFNTQYSNTPTLPVNGKMGCYKRPVITMRCIGSKTFD
jgi:hypothetical protein